MGSNQPDSADEWLILAERHEAGARQLLEAGSTDLAWFNAGLSVECMLKAAIMRKDGLNRWPERPSRPDLWTHDLTRLAKAAGINLPGLITDPISAAFLVVLLWRRGEGYNPKTMPLRVASDMVLAATGKDGVNQWIAKRFQLIR